MNKEQAFVGTGSSCKLQHANGEFSLLTLLYIYQSTWSGEFYAVVKHSQDNPHEQEAGTESEYCLKDLVFDLPIAVKP